VHGGRHPQALPRKLRCRNHRSRRPERRNRAKAGGTGLRRAGRRRRNASGRTQFPRRPQAHPPVCGATGIGDDPPGALVSALCKVMRIFIGIDLDPEVRALIERFLEGVRGFAPDARWVRPESLHITLKFIGEQPPERVEAISERLRRVEGGAFEIRSAGYGFFPTAKAPRVFWIGIEAEPQLVEMAEKIDMAVADLGIPREDRPY